MNAATARATTRTDSARAPDPAVPRPVQGDGAGVLVSAKELAAAAGLILAGMLVAVNLANGAPMFTRGLWLDEILAWLVATDPDVGHAMSALAAAVDMNPPLYHLSVGAFGAAVGGLTPGVMRSFAFGSVCLALVGMYACLRPTLGRAPAIAGVTLFWAFPLVSEHAFQGRMYAPLLAAVVWFCYFVRAAVVVPNAGALRTAMRVATAMTAAIVCAMHYFGIMAWGCAVAGQWLADRRPWRAKFRAYWPALAGPAALALCVPLIVSQRRAVAGLGTYLDPVDAEQLRSYASAVLPMLPLLIVAAAALLHAVVPRLRRPTATAGGDRTGAAPSRGTLRDLAGLISVAGVALAVPAFSLAVQPALLPRYTITATAGLAAAGAVVLAWCRPRPVTAAVITVTLFAACVWGFKRVVQTQITMEWRDVVLSDALSETDAGVPVVFASRELMYPAVHHTADVADRCFYLVGDPATSDRPRFDAFENRMAEAVARHYPRFAVMDAAHAATLERLYVVGPEPPAALAGRAWREVPQIAGTRMFEFGPAPPATQEKSGPAPR